MLEVTAPPPEALMPAEVVVELCQLFDKHGIQVWLDGGWGVDALLGAQTRPHGDLDIAIQAADVPLLRMLLAAKGYTSQPRGDTSAWNFVLADSAGHELDVHVIEFDELGNGSYGPPANGQMYPASSLTGTGSVLGQPVRCIAARDLVQFHLGYELDENDYHDVAALCERFDLELPAEYERFQP
jgi:lincosamide nucleotidyltransferase A/C/D/E